MLLIDEVDRVEVETEALLLEILSDYQVSIPELGTIEAKQIPLVFLTSNNTRELSEALKRRCLFLHVDYPDLEREKEIVLTKVPDITDTLADQVARIVRSIRQLELKKAPSVSETLDWARTLMLLGVEHVDAETAKAHDQHPAQVPDRHRQGDPRARPGERHRSRRPRRARPRPVAPTMTDVEHARHRRRRAGGRLAIIDLLAGFIEELRQAGLPVSLTENLDAMEAVEAHPARGPRGVQVRARRHAREEQRPLAGLRDRLRGVLLAAGLALQDRRRRPEDELAELLEELEQQGEQQGDGPRTRLRRRRGDDARGARRDALQGAAEGRRGADARRGPPVGPPLRRHGARPSRRRHLLPLPDAAEPRPRRRARPAHGRRPRRGRRSRSPRSRSASSRTSTRPASSS